MQQYFIRFDNENDLQNILGQISENLGEPISLEHSNIWQTSGFALEYLGRIPKPDQDYTEEGELIGELQYEDGYHINIISEHPFDCDLIDADQVHPAIPFRVFSN